MVALSLTLRWPSARRCLCGWGEGCDAARPDHGGAQWPGGVLHRALHQHPGPAHRLPPHPNRQHQLLRQVLPCESHTHTHTQIVLKANCATLQRLCLIMCEGDSHRPDFVSWCNIFWLSQNQIYIPPKDLSACCGVCVNISCLYKNENSSVTLYKVVCAEVTHQ